MDTDYFYRTPYLGRLMDPRNFEHGHAGSGDSERPYRGSSVGNSPRAARDKGAEISGRVISVTTSLAHIIVRDDASGTFRLRKRRGLTTLNSAMSFLESRTNWEVINVGWTGEIETAPGKQYEGVLSDREKDRLREDFSKAEDCEVHPVFLPAPASQWREYAEHTLWPSFHYMQSVSVEAISKQSAGWDCYKAFNEAYAEVLERIYQPGDIIWIHDFYFLLLPGMLRKSFLNAEIGFFLHAPFPSSEFVRCIPQRAELLEGVLGSTIIGLQSESYVRHFVSACIRVLGNDHTVHELLFEGRVISCYALPIGIDIEHVIQRTESRSVKDMSNELQRVYAGKKVVIGRDKLDSLESVIQKLKAFELFLHAYPEWREKVVLVQVTTPVYEHSPKLEKKVAEMVAEINGLYGNMHFWPIQHYSRHIDQDEYFALLEMADLGMFTSVRDGTSHAALEYVACQRHRGCPLILSEFMGLAGIVKDALVVNPYDAMTVAQTINIALTQRRQHEKGNMFKTIARLNVGDWVKSFLGCILKHSLRHQSKHLTPELRFSQLRKGYETADRRLFLFDYDGTLTPIVRDPAAAIPSERLKKILTELCSDEKNNVWVISGRDQHFLDRYLGNFRLSLSGEHGSFLKRRGEEKWIDLASAVDNSWKKIVLEILQSYTERTEGSNIEQKTASITWHYRRADPVFGAFQASNLRTHLEKTIATVYPVDVLSGKANVEVRPRMHNKGEIVRMIFEEFKEMPNFALCMGDDTTDEDMFKVVNEQDRAEEYFTVLVGPSDKLTNAHEHVPNVRVVHDALEDMMKH